MTEKKDERAGWGGGTENKIWIPSPKHGGRRGPKFVLLQTE